MSRVAAPVATTNQNRTVDSMLIGPQFSNDDLDAAIITSLATIGASPQLDGARVHFSEGHIQVVVLFESFWPVEVALRMSGAHALRIAHIASLIWGGSEPNTDDAIDCLGELTNIIAGNLKGFGPDPSCRLSTPHLRAVSPSRRDGWTTLKRRFVTAASIGVVSVSWPTHSSPQAA